MNGRCSLGFQSTSGDLLSLLLRSPHFDRMGVASLLPRRLIQFTKSLLSSCVDRLLFAGFPEPVSSPRILLLRVLHALSQDNSYSSLTNFSVRALRRLHQPLLQSNTLCRYVPTV